MSQYNERLQYIVVEYELPMKYGKGGKREWEILVCNIGAIISKGIICELLSNKIEVQFKMSEITFHSIAITIK